MFFLGLFSPLISFFTGVWSKLLSWRPSISQIIAIVAIAGFTVQTVRIDGLFIQPKFLFIKITLLDITGFKTDVANLNKRIADMYKASDESRDRQIKENSRNSDNSKIVSGRINQDELLNQNKVLTALRNHITTSNAMCMPRADQTSSGGYVQDTSVRKTIDASVDSDGKSVDPIMVSIPNTEYQQLTINTEKLLTLQSYFKIGIDAGWFVPWSDAPIAPTSTDKK